MSRGISASKTFHSRFAFAVSSGMVLSSSRSCRYFQHQVSMKMRALGSSSRTSSTACRVGMLRFG
ncbi:MAG: hypothetical protein DMG07_06800 [Acidobacteria bacterium]|nr:MAG: hypothetical protein DMG07_06800 [Acidobacteriota bacterium]